MVPAANEGLYDSRFEHDACGVGFVADLRAGGGHEVVASALRVLCNLEHRGAAGADPDTGDGAGILVLEKARTPRRELARLLGYGARSDAFHPTAPDPSGRWLGLAVQEALGAADLANQASGGHDFAAPDFFAAATVSPEDRGKIAKGRVALGGGDSVDLRLTAPASRGRYLLRCTHFMHAAFGMKGAIVVD